MEEFEKYDPRPSKSLADIQAIKFLNSPYPLSSSVQSDNINNNNYNYNGDYQKQGLEN